MGLGLVFLGMQLLGSSTSKKMVSYSLQQTKPFYVAMKTGSSIQHAWKKITRWITNESSLKQAEQPFQSSQPQPDAQHDPRGPLESRGASPSSQEYRAPTILQGASSLTLPDKPLPEILPVMMSNADDMSAWGLMFLNREIQMV